MAATNDFKPGTRWRNKSVTEIQGKLVRTSSHEPTYIVHATDHHVIYETHWGPGFANRTEKIARRKDFERNYEVSCCERHDREPDWTGECHTVPVPDEGVFLVVNGEVCEAMITGQTFHHSYNTYTVQIRRKDSDDSP